MYMMKMSDYNLGAKYKFKVFVFQPLSQNI